MWKKIVLGVVSLAIIGPASLSLAGPGGLATRDGGSTDQFKRQGDRPLSNTNQMRGDSTRHEDNDLVSIQLKKRKDLYGKSHPKGPDLQNNPGFQHGMSQATTHGKGKKKGLGRGMQKGKGHRR